MQKRMKNLIISNIIVALATIIFIIYSLIAMRFEIGKCWTVTLFHVYCPGCGGTRALYSLIQLDFLSVLKYNPILPMAVLVYGYYNIRAFIEIKRDNEEYFKKNKFILVYVVIALGFIYFLIRNILLLCGIDLIGDIIIS